MASALHPGCGYLYPVYYVETQNLDKFGGTSTIDASIMVFGLLKFCVST